MMERFDMHQISTHDDARNTQETVGIPSSDFSL